MLKSVGTKNTLHLLLELKILCKILLIFSQSYIKMVVSFYSTGHVRNVFLNNFGILTPDIEWWRFDKIMNVSECRNCQ